MSAKETTKVDFSDTLFSKLEIALWLAKWIIIGVFVLFAIALVIWVVVGTVGEIEIQTGDSIATVYKFNVEHAKQAVNLLLPIVTANVGALIGYILGTANKTVAQAKLDAAVKTD